MLLSIDLLAVEEPEELGDAVQVQHGLCQQEITKIFELKTR